MMQIPEASQDIPLFVKHELQRARDIGPMECSTIVMMSEGLFQWAAVACHVMDNRMGGGSAREQLNKLLHHSGVMAAASQGYWMKSIRLYHNKSPDKAEI
jgi:hypothetical protein